MSEKKRWLCDYDHEKALDDIYEDIKDVLNGNKDNPIYKEYSRFDETGDGRTKHKYLDAIVYSIIKKYDRQNAREISMEFIKKIPRKNRRSENSTMIQDNFREILGSGFEIFDNTFSLKQYRDQLEKYSGYPKTDEHKENLLIVLSDNEKLL